MASVFLSYDREDLEFARPVANALEKDGHSVWWDRHIKGGAQYAKEIEQALSAADAVVVLWSKHSLESAWVRDEAAAGRDSGRLVPVSLDSAEPPLGFRQYQTINLSGWKGRGTSVQLRTLIEAVDALGADKTEAAPIVVQKIEAGAAAPKHRGYIFLAAITAILLALTGLFLWRPWEGSSIPVVEITGADSTAEARSMANDLLVKLNSLQGARADAVELTGEQQSGSPDLRFAVGASNRGQIARATLVLLDGRTNALLWSTDFELPSSQQANLQQQIAIQAGQALNCALDGLAGEKAGLKQPVLKLYLRGCASIDDLDYANLYQLIPVFRQVVARAPKFEAGWAKLIQVEALAEINNPTADPSLMGFLKKHIAEARRLNPHLAEAYLAEVELIPPTDHGARLRLTELATEHNPAHPEPFAARAYYLRLVGRTTDAVAAAKRASELNQLSPAIRNDYITALTYAGQFDRARHELESAERFWPDSTAVRSARFLLELRYGDPQHALRLSRMGISASAPQLTESFLKARIDSTAGNVEEAVGQALAHYRRDPTSIALVVQTLGTFQRKDDLFSILQEGGAPALEREGSPVLFGPALREFRRDPRFMGLAKRLGLIGYWRASGKWPDFCFEPGMPYDCIKEAAKLS